MTHNPISSPAHYTAYPVQPIVITRHLGFCLGNTVKYVMRAPFKNGAEDLLKAEQYLQWERETPSALPTPPAYNIITEAVQSLVDYLASPDRGPRSPLRDAQAAFLIALTDYLSSGIEEHLESLMSGINVMWAIMVEDATGNFSGILTDRDV